MIVFKNYLKIAKTYIYIIITYTVIFVGISVISSLNNNQNQVSYEKEEVNIAFIDHDHSEFISQFKDYVEDNATIINIDDDEESLKDALFFRKVDYIMIIPDSFTDDFIDGKDVSIQTMQVPEAYGAIYSKTLMNKYLNTANIYIKAGIDIDDVSAKVKNDLNIDTAVHMKNYIDNSDLQSIASFFNFSNYALLAVIIVVVSMIIVSFNKIDIKKRNLVSSKNYNNINFQLLLGNIVISFVIWFVYILIITMFYTEAMFSMHGLLYIINSLCLLIFILTFSFFITKMTDNRELISGVSNVVSLGFSFLGGAFVPQEYLGSFVLNLAKFTPSYWFIKNNNEIALLTKFDFESIYPIFCNMIIILLFALLSYIIVLLVTFFRKKK